MQLVSDQDLHILSQLRKNSRAQLTNISRQTGIPVSTLFNKIRSYEGSIIDRYTCTLNYEVLGFSLSIRILIKVHKNSKDQLSLYLRKQGNINSVYKINNGYDFMIEGIFRNLNDAENFFEELETRHRILKKEVFYVVDKVKEEGFLTDLLALGY